MIGPSGGDGCAPRRSTAMRNAGRYETIADKLRKGLRTAGTQVTVCENSKTILPFVLNTTHLLKLIA